MKRTINASVHETLEIARALKGLPRERAPRALLPAVLRRVGLADSYWRIDSAIGEIYVAHSRAGISMVSRARSAREFQKAFESRFDRPIGSDRTPPPANVEALVAGRLRDRDAHLRFDLRGLSEFERAVLLKALGHRVVRTDGHLGNYSLGGPRNKRVLLAAEGAQPETLEKLAASGVRYFGNEAGRYFCFPTCGGIDSLLEENRVHFSSQREALAAGYKPCAECRPAAA